MASFCEYCGADLSPEDRICPHCGAPVPGVPAEPETGRGGVPLTIEELKSFCRSKNMPLSQMRFFIGEDQISPRAFGIYQDERGDFVVYKNKADGTRVLRYKGPDEAHAVHEIYRKLQDEVSRRRSDGRTVYPSNGGRAVSSSRSSRADSSLSALGRILSVLFAVVLGILVLFFSFRTGKTPGNGYYRYEDVVYYLQGDDWYYYSPSMLSWTYAGLVDEELQNNPRQYFESSRYSRDLEVDSFSESPFYEPEDNDSTSDSGDDWGTDDSSWDFDYDSWDSGDTDWSSDW